jgi:arylformamidase
MSIYRSFDKESLDREYSPSSKVDDINVYLDSYQRDSAAAKQAALQDNLCHADLRYGDGQEEMLDLFLPADGKPAPLHVFIHGGYWQLLSKNESCFAAPLMLRNGGAFAAVNYTLAPHQTLSGIVAENRRAIAWLYRNAGRYGIDPQRIFVSGHSAGAHLAMMLLLTDWEAAGLPRDVVKGVCAVSGVFDLEPVSLSYVNDVVGMDAAEARQNSPILHPPRNTCPVIFAYGEDDTAEFKRQTDDYHAAWSAMSLPSVLQEVAARNHFDVILDLADGDSWLAGQVLAQMGIGQTR